MADDCIPCRTVLRCGFLQRSLAIRYRARRGVSGLLGRILALFPSAVSAKESGGARAARGRVRFARISNAHRRSAGAAGQRTSDRSSLDRSPRRLGVRVRLTRHLVASASRFRGRSKGGGANFCARTLASRGDKPRSYGAAHRINWPWRSLVGQQDLVAGAVSLDLRGVRDFEVAHVELLHRDRRAA